MNKLAGIALWLSLVLGLSACGLFSKIITPGDVIRNERQLRKALETNALEYRWFKSRASLSIRTPDQKIRGGANLLMRKDSLLWARVSKFIEVARVQVLPEEITLLNRIEQTYQTMNLQLALEQLDLGDEALSGMQKLMLAEYPFALQNGQEVRFYTDSILIEQQYQTGSYKVVLHPSTLKMQQITAHSTNGNVLRVKYSDFVNLEKAIIPQHIDVVVEGQNDLELTIDLQNSSFEAFEQVAFEIPSNYTKVE